MNCDSSGSMRVCNVIPMNCLHLHFLNRSKNMSKYVWIVNSLLFLCMRKCNQLQYVARSSSSYKLGTFATADFDER